MGDSPDAKFPFELDWDCNLTWGLSVMFKHIAILRLHKAVANPFLVKLYSYFEDSNFVYIVLEICRKRYLMILLTFTALNVRNIPFSGVLWSFTKEGKQSQNQKPDTS